MGSGRKGQNKMSISEQFIFQSALDPIKITDSKETQDTTTTTVPSKDLLGNIWLP